jgi:hypothetical protein
MRIQIRVLLLIEVMGTCDHWSTDPPGPMSLQVRAFIVSVYGPPRLYFLSL